MPPEEAEGEVKAHYDAAVAVDGYLQNQELLFGLNPAAKAAWRGLVQAITARMDRRRYELVTLAVANELRCRYCVSAHAAVVLDSNIFDREQVEAITRDFRTADCLTPAEVALMAFAQKMTVDANRITPDDV
ncbi:MAG TPA: carboxymuconolactone decarboxylase family protein, partial [Mycobacterium sp.]|nr:carboxymuconolactone decarboxylase family protein [Mycobacterium sp.]